MKAIKWTRDGKKLTGRLANQDYNGYVEFLTEEDFVKIGQWCYENNCGVRISYDTFRFKTRADITAFLLRWS